MHNIKFYYDSINSLTILKLKKENQNKCLKKFSSRLGILKLCFPACKLKL